MDTPYTTTAEELYILYHRDLVCFFAGHLADREAAWDLCHDVYVRLLLTLASGTQVYAPQRWLLRVAKNLLIDTYRHRQSAEAPLPLGAPELTLLDGDATTFRTLLDDCEILQSLVDAFQALSAKDQKLLTWRDIERRPLQEIA